MVVGVLVALLGFVLALAPSGAPAQSTDVSREEAIRQLDVVRQSIDRTLDADQGRPAHSEAFDEAKDGYLSHFEFVEVPLRVVDPTLTSDAETKFAEIRGLITDNASIDEIRSNIVELRGLIDDAERQLTDEGIGAPAVVFGQSFLIIFREGLEAVLLVSVLLGYLEAAKATQYRRPILLRHGRCRGRHGRDVLRPAHACSAALPFGREVLEAITALLAVVRALLRLVLAGGAARAEAMARVPARPRVERGVGRLDRRRSCWSGSLPSTARASRPRSSTRRCCRSAPASACGSRPGCGAGVVVLAGRRDG